MTRKWAFSLGLIKTLLPVRSEAILYLHIAQIGKYFNFQWEYKTSI